MEARRDTSGGTAVGDVLCCLDRMMGRALIRNSASKLTLDVGVGVGQNPSRIESTVL